jgi:hypothetical protein
MSCFGFGPLAASTHSFSELLISNLASLVLATHPEEGRGFTGFEPARLERQIANLKLQVPNNLHCQNEKSNKLPEI